ncbi:MAG: class I SAM-dependent methyltransferase [Planctomycetota bacterium]|jgi:2-polyprenyl-3-methyl-5-hydroxy-6-metoxy-1,4-benzoquinol methylase
MYNKWLDSDIGPEFGEIEEISLYHCPDCDLKFFFPAISGSEGFYEKLQTFDWYYRYNKSKYEYAKNFVKSTGLLLEIGGGKGAFAQQIMSKAHVGLELSQTAVDAASKNGINAKKETIQNHAKNHSVEYDVVCAFQVLEHVVDVNSFIGASLACLRPG